MSANNTGSTLDTGTIGDNANTSYYGIIAGSSRAKRFHWHCSGNRHYSTGTIEEIGTVGKPLVYHNAGTEATAPGGRGGGSTGVAAASLCTSSCSQVLQK